MRQPKLARTLEIIAEKGGDEFYEGELAEEIVQDNRDAGKELQRILCQGQ